MAEKIPYLITCRCCGQQNIQFSVTAEALRGYCSNACRTMVHNNNTEYPIRKPVALTMDEYVKVAFTIKVVTSAIPKPGPAPKQPAKKIYPRKPKRDPLDFRCPTKFKRTYATTQLAWDFIQEVHPDDEYIRPYTCTCGAIHIGHSAVPVNAR